MRSIVKEADIILPNLTEAAFLLDIPYNENYNKDDIKDILVKLSEMGPKISILTGVSFKDGELGAIAYNKETGEYVSYFAEKISKSYHGTGDVFSSVAVANLVNGTSVENALQNACEFVVKSIKNTLADTTHNYGVKFESVLAE